MAAAVGDRGTGGRSVTFDSSARAGRTTLIRVLAPRQSLSTVLWILFGVTLYVIGAWVFAVLVGSAFDLDPLHREALFTLFLIVLLTIGLWQQASRGAVGPQGTYGVMTVSLEQEGLRIATAAFDLRCAWTAVDKVVVDKGHLVITYLGGRGVAVPAEAFGGDEVLRDFAKAASDLKGGAAPSH